MESLTSGINYLLQNWLTGWMGMLLYWLPLSICIVGYTLRTFENYQKDLIEREKYRNLKNKRKALEGNEEELEKLSREIRSTSSSDKYTSYYSPTDKIGTLVGRAVVSIVPVARACYRLVRSRKSDQSCPCPLPLFAGG